MCEDLLGGNSLRPTKKATQLRECLLLRGRYSMVVKNRILGILWAVQIPDDSFYVFVIIQWINQTNWDLYPDLLCIEQKLTRLKKLIRSSLYMMIPLHLLYLFVNGLFIHNALHACVSMYGISKPVYVDWPTCGVKAQIVLFFAKYWCINPPRPKERDRNSTLMLWTQ